MRDAVAFLLLCSTRNWAKRMARRLRSPRYAAAVVLGAAYLALILYGPHREAGAAIPARAVGIGGGLLLLLLVLKWWLFGADRLALAFTPSEIQFFFPAPVSRSALLGYKLVRAQRIVLPNVLIWTFFLRRGEGTVLGTLPYALTMWAFFSTLSLHRLGVALTRDSVVEHGRSGLRRIWPAVVVLLLLVGSVWLSVHLVPGGFAARGSVDPLGGLGAAASIPPLSWVLWLFRVPLWPLEAQTVTQWLPRFLLALLLTGVHLRWVIRSDRAFEEAAIEASARRAELVERLRKHGPRRTGRPRRLLRWIPLGATGHPVRAIIWKNLTRLVRTMSPAVPVLVFMMLVATAGLAISQGQRASAALALVGTLTLAWTAVLAIFGPHWVRIDLRGDLEHLALLRTWPLSGTTLMTSEVLSSALVLTLSEVLLAGSGLAALRLAGEPLPLFSRFPVLGPVAVLILCGLNLIALCLQNAAAILFPAWVRTEIRPGGIEQTGQHLLTAGASILLLGLAALGPGLVGLGVGYAAWEAIGDWAMVPAGLACAAGLGLEAVLFLDWLGSRFERTDPTAA